jgi:hypothetical protein
MEFFFVDFLALINEFWDYIFDSLTPFGIGFRLEGY